LDSDLFVNFYETLGVEPGATADLIESRFRQLARRYHPDNLSTGDRAMFDAVVEAHETLKDPARRALYHEQHARRLPPYVDRTSGVDEAPDSDGAERSVSGGLFDEMGIAGDIAVQNNILALLYQRRRQNIKEPGVGNGELEILTGCPEEHLEFHLWYLREKGWIAKREDGLMAITIDGVDRAAAIYREGANKRITDRT